MNNWWLFASAAMGMVFLNLSSPTVKQQTSEKLLFTHRMHGLYMNIIDTLTVGVSKIPWTGALKMSQLLFHIVHASLYNYIFEGGASYLILFN